MNRGPPGSSIGPLKGEERMSDRDIEQSVMRRVSRRLLPFLFLLYVFNFLDRTNVGVAALQMNADLNFSPGVFGLGAGLFFAAYALCEVPSNLILARLGARRWIAIIMIVWGLIACAMRWVRTPAEFYTVRFLLGMAEAGFFPGIIYYLGTWFPAAYQARAFAAFTLGIPVSQAIGTPVGGALLLLDGVGDLRGWEWLFLIEGAPSVVLGVIVFLTLTDRPGEASWLSAQERRWLTERLEGERNAGEGTHGAWWRALTDARVWALAIPWFAIYALGLGIIFWSPLIVREALGTGNTATSLIAGAVPLSTAVIFPLIARWSDRHDERSGVAAVGLFLGAVGCLGMALLPHSPWRIGALFIISLHFALCLPVYWCMPMRLLKGPSAAAGIAFINAIGACGGFFGPTIIGFLKQATGSDAGAFVGLGAIAFIGGCVCLGLRRMELFQPQRAQATLAGSLSAAKGP